MAEWRCLHPEDVAGEEAFCAAKKAEQRERRAARREKMERKKYIKSSSRILTRRSRTPTIR
jgi:hypothetical protein